MACIVPHHGNRGAPPPHALDAIDINVSRETLMSLTVRDVSRETSRLAGTIQEDARGTTGIYRFQSIADLSPKFNPSFKGTRRGVNTPREESFWIQASGAERWRRTE